MSGGWSNTTKRKEKRGRDNKKRDKEEKKRGREEKKRGREVEREKEKKYLLDLRKCL
jgi:hypothetical protein